MTHKLNQSDEKLSRALRELAAASRQGVSPEAGLTVKEAFRRRHVRRKQMLRIRAAMICVCVAGLAMLFLIRRPSPPGGAGKVPVVRTIPPQEVIYPAEVSAARITGRRPAPPPRTSPAQNAPAATAGFLALPSSAMLSPSDELHVLRLEMRGEDLRLVGAPITEEIAARRVTADFVVGHDGTPYAVRLVRSNF